jgi:hypothetical protein
VQRYALLEGITAQGNAIGIENLKMVNANFLTVCVSPNHLFGAVDFEQLWRVNVLSSSRITGNDNVPIGEHLAATRVL